MTWCVLLGITYTPFLAMLLLLIKIDETE